MANVDKAAYSVTDVINATSLGRTTIYKLLKEGRLRSVLIGNRRLISADSIRELISPSTNN